MSEIKVMVQSTPNPNALKFILNTAVKSEGKVTFKNPSDCATIPLAAAIFAVPNVRELHFFDNVITVSQDGYGDWDALVDQIRAILLEKIAAHDANFEVATKEPERQLSAELAKIDQILDRTVRPALQGDGGDIRVISLEGSVLTVNYQGACGSCPSSTMGTLKAIEGILREEFDPNIEVQPV